MADILSRPQCVLTNNRASALLRYFIGHDTGECVSRLYWTSTESMEYVYITHALSCASMSTGDKWRMILKKRAKYDVV